VQDDLSDRAEARTSGRYLRLRPDSPHRSPDAASYQCSPAAGPAVGPKVPDLIGWLPGGDGRVTLEITQSG
jgi:hypothetical protein